MFINWAKREISVKIVYYGPGLSGKTTNLEYIYSKIDPSYRGEIVSLKTKDDRTIFFDFMQFELGSIRGKKPHFRLYTVPGQRFYASSRKIILSGADGIVFVADSQRNRLRENLDSMLDLEQNLIAEGRSMADLPFVLQYNKRDLDQILAVGLLQKKLNFLNAPYYEAVANRGIGVVETLKMTIQLVIEDIERKLRA
ncbi:mutual gliding-motility protein MglA [bacterium BMS3Abin05]|nr:mutual gliding-motility protein MglA [bacterium BMS3Abin05]GBE27630.1 mutual gliding-motility protein MglA [bacterium BMS3Bbin03]HDZ12179.1 gliding-motility protein MglA [Bacteroidota bacterium]